MAGKKIAVFILNRPVNGVQHEARVMFDKDLEEFTTKFYRNDVHQRKADYFTDDLTDALGTAKLQLFELGGREVAVCDVYRSTEKVTA